MPVNNGIARPHTSWREGFTRGFRNTSPLILAAALALVVPAAPAIHALFAGGAWSHRPLRYWLRTANDDFVAVSWTVAHIKDAPRRAPIVAFLGSSTAREAVSSGPSLGRAITADGGPDVEAYTLASSNQNFAEDVAVLDNLPARGSTVVLGINVNSFIFDPDISFQQVVGRELLLSSATLAAYWRDRAGMRDRAFGILPGVFYYASTYVRSHAITAVRGGPWFPEYDPHFYDHLQPLTQSTKAGLVGEWIRSVRPLYQANFAANAALLDLFVRRAKQLGIGVVIVELPRNTEVLRDTLAADSLRYQQILRAYAARGDVVYVDFNDRLQLTSDDFYDLAHLRGSGRARWESALASPLAHLMGRTLIGRRQP